MFARARSQASEGRQGARPAKFRARARRACTWALSAWAALAAAAIATPGEAAPPTVEPDPEVQAALDNLASTLGPWSDRSAWCEWFLKAESLTKEQHEGIVGQFLYFYSYSSNPYKDRLSMYQVLHFAALDRHLIVAALVPYLESPDSKIAEQALRYLHVFDQCTCAACRAGIGPGVAGIRPGVDVVVYLDFFQRALAEGKDPPRVLTRYLYERDPGGVVLMLTGLREYFGRTREELLSADERKAIFWAEHVISDTIWKHEYGFLDKDKVEPEAARELERLARHKEWWVRLYAAEIMRQHAAFRREVLVRRLAKDRHPLVREVAEKIQAQKDGNEGGKQDDGG